jgi:uncharacterized FlaG/YvyC family protein
MEVNLPLGGASYPNPLQSIALDPFVPRIVLAGLDAKPAGSVTEQKASEQGEDDLHEILERTADLVSIFDRSLKFEVIKDAGILQIQVIDSSDGMVVRKIPSDEIVKLVTHIRDKLSDNMDVLA